MVGHLNLQLKDTAQKVNPLSEGLAFRIGFFTYDMKLKVSDTHQSIYIKCTNYDHDIHRDVPNFMFF